MIEVTTTIDMTGAEIAALQQARETLVQRLMVKFPASVSSGSLRERGKAEKRQEQELRGQTYEMDVARVIQFHQLLDYADWQPREEGGQ